MLEAIGHTNKINFLDQIILSWFFLFESNSYITRVFFLAAEVGFYNLQGASLLWFIHTSNICGCTEGFKFKRYWDGNMSPSFCESSLDVKSHSRRSRWITKDSNLMFTFRTTKVKEKILSRSNTKGSLR